MKRAIVAGGTVAVLLVVLALAVGFQIRERSAHPAATTSTPASSTAPAEGETRSAAGGEPKATPSQGILYGRITTVDGARYEGRLRFGGDQEAFWGNYFNGSKRENTWAANVPPERLPKEHRRLTILGFQVAEGDRPYDLGRLFMARFGDIARIEAHGGDVRVTLKSGTVFELNRFDASDFDDGLRVWDGGRGVVDRDSLRIRTIELLPTTPALPAAPERLHGTVRTRERDFTGFVQWNREKCIGADEIHGQTAGGETSVRFDTIRTIAPRTAGGSVVTLLDGRTIELTGSGEVGQGNRGIYVDDPRYGRVLISWDAFERLDFDSGGSGPAYGDFPTGRPLSGTVTTRAGDRLTGRLVYDLDESETTETLDAPSEGVDYTIPFGLVASIEVPGREERGDARVTLHGGEELRLERAGDLGERNAGMLVFADGRERPEYLSWADVQRVDFDRPPAMFPPLGGR